jgi:hypothetical protein
MRDKGLHRTEQPNTILHAKYTHTLSHTHIHTVTHMHTRIHTHAHEHTLTHTHSHTCTHTHTQSLTRMHTHAHTHKLSLSHTHARAVWWHWPWKTSQRYVLCNELCVRQSKTLRLSYKNNYNDTACMWVKERQTGADLSSEGLPTNTNILISMHVLSRHL